MPYPIEIISIGGDFDAQIAEAAQALDVQAEFSFALPPQRLRRAGSSLVKEKYRSFRQSQKHVNR
jgi:hypothetical protein